MAIKAAPGERYTIRRQVFRILGAGFDVYDAQGQPIGYCKQRALRLREDMRVYTDRSESTELLRISARQIIDLGATYDVKLPSGETIGSLRRKALKSMLKDEWHIMDPSGRQIAVLVEDSMFKAIVRRFVDFGALLLPQRFSMTDGNGTRVATFRQHFNPIIYRLGISVHADHAELDDLMVLATACLLAAIEGRQG